MVNNNHKIDRKTKKVIEEAIFKLEKWIVTHNYMVYEPFDGLNS